MIGNFMPGDGWHIFPSAALGEKHCIFCDETEPGPGCRREPAIETLMYQALVLANSRPCASWPCDREFPGMPSRWCSGCIVAALVARIGWLLPESATTHHAGARAVEATRTEDAPKLSPPPTDRSREPE